MRSNNSSLHVFRRRPLYRQEFSSKGMFAKHNLSRHREYLDHTSISGHPAFHCHIKAPCFAERVVEYFGLQKYFGSVYGSERTAAPAPTKAVSWRMSLKPSPCHRTRRLWLAIASMISWAQEHKAGPLVHRGLTDFYGSYGEFVAAL